MPFGSPRQSLDIIKMALKEITWESFALDSSSSNIGTSVRLS